MIQDIDTLLTDSSTITHAPFDGDWNGSIGKIQACIPEIKRKISWAIPKVEHYSAISQDPHRTEFFFLVDLDKVDAVVGGVGHIWREFIAAIEKSIATSLAAVRTNLSTLPSTSNSAVQRLHAKLATLEHNLPVHKLGLAALSLLQPAHVYIDHFNDLQQRLTALHTISFNDTDNQWNAIEVYCDATLLQKALVTQRDRVRAYRNENRVATRHMYFVKAQKYLQAIHATEKSAPITLVETFFALETHLTTQIKQAEGLLKSCKKAFAEIAEDVESFHQLQRQAAYYIDDNRRNELDTSVAQTQQQWLRGMKNHIWRVLKRDALIEHERRRLLLDAFLAEALRHRAPVTVVMPDLRNLPSFPRLP